MRILSLKFYVMKRRNKKKFPLSPPNRASHLLEIERLQGCTREIYDKCKPVRDDWLIVREAAVSVRAMAMVCC